MARASRSKKDATNHYVLGALAVGGLLILHHSYTLPAAAKSSVAAWYSILPPLLAVSLALITKKLIPSLVAAILVGGYLVHVPAAATSFAAWESGFFEGPKFITNSLSDWINLQILFFVFLVLAMISVMIVAGGLQGVVKVLSKYAKGRKNTQIITAILGLAVFIDDYANTMIVGSSMRNLSDREKISREKLAFLVDATAAPIAGIAFVSTWIGYQVGLFTQVSKTSGIGKDGYAMFFDSLPFRFYCFLMIIFVLINVFTGLDYGPMKKAENRALKKGEVLAKGSKALTSGTFTQLKPYAKIHISPWTALGPIIILFTYLLTGMWLDGGGGALFNQSALNLISADAWREVFTNSENGTKILAYAAGCGFLSACTFAVGWAKLSVGQILTSALAGLRASLLPTVILILAWSLKGTCDSLNTGEFLVHAVGDILSPFWFPALLFIISGLVAFSTGTSWGTMAILIPTAIPIAYQLDGGTYSLVTMICLGAILDGAIFGDHCSPISDTTIMSSIASSCDHIDHVKTQFPYATTVGVIALLCGYLPAALGTNPWMGILAGSVAIAGVYWGVKRNLFKKAKNLVSG